MRLPWISLPLVSMHIQLTWSYLVNVVVLAALAHPAYISDAQFENVKSMFHFSVNSLGFWLIWRPHQNLCYCAAQVNLLDYICFIIPIHFALEVDHTFGLESRRRAEDILVAKKALYHFQVFSQVQHGFASRGDPNDPNIRKHFTHHFSSPH